MSVNARDRIIETTKRLCNEYKASSVTTNLIAAEMGISTGHLYYYFNNKEEIIREIYHQLWERMNAVWYAPEFKKSEQGIVEFYFGLNKALYDYRFCYLELYVLMNKDPELKEENARRTVKLINHFASAFDSWVAAGIMKRFKDKSEKLILATNSFMVGQFWITNSHIIYDKVTSDIVADGIMYMYSTLRPYFKKESNKLMVNLIYSSLATHPSYPFTEYFRNP